MKNNFSTNRIIFYILLLAFAGLGTWIGSKIYKNDILANGILGCFTVYLIFLHYIRITHSGNELTEFDIDFPKSIKYILLVWILSVIAYIALKNAISLVSLL